MTALLFLAIACSSCIHTSYLLDQGWGQLRLITGGNHLQEVLADPKISEGDKSKIRHIQKAKEHFYRYWKKEPTAIYSKVIFLEQKAVSYLVVASPFDRIEARRECFPVAGCFPYLGFFDQKKARAHASKLQADNWETYVRPVHAYSTLGYFNDRILSSFFQYGDYALAELVFHELFHTLFFAKGEVELNENLANYFSQEMVAEYFQLNPQQKLERQTKRRQRQKLSVEVAKLANKLNARYLQHTALTPKDAQQLRQQFLDQTFFPQIRKVCGELNLVRCFPLERRWNNASLAAFLTYQSEQNSISSLREKLQLELRDFFHHIERRYQEYQKGGKKGPFADFLLRVGK